MTLREYLRKEPKFASVSGALILTGLIGIFALRTRPSFSLELAFLLPVCLAAWGAGGQAGVFFSTVGALTAAASVSGKPGALLSPVFYWNALSQMGVFLLVSVTLPALKREWDQERNSGSIDAVTRLPNLKSFLAAAQTEIERSHRYKHPFTIAAMDVDNFKFVTQRYGHSAGDTLLRAAAQTVRSKIRGTDLAGRLGADEFGLLLPETQSGAAGIVLRRIQSTLLDLMEKNEWPVTFSIGAVTFLQPPESAEAMFRRVDALLARVKEEGRNAIRYEVVAPLQSSPD